MLDDIDRISATWCTRYSSGRIDVDTSEALGVELLMSDSWQVCWAPTSTTANIAGYRASFVSVGGGATRVGRGAKRKADHKKTRIKNHEHEQQRNQDQDDQQNDRSLTHENKTTKDKINDHQKRAQEQERSPNGE